MQILVRGDDRARNAKVCQRSNQVVGLKALFSNRRNTESDADRMAAGNLLAEPNVRSELPTILLVFRIDLPAEQRVPRRVQGHRQVRWLEDSTEPEQRAREEVRSLRELPRGTVELRPTRQNRSVDQSAAV